MYANILMIFCFTKTNHCQCCLFHTVGLSIIHLMDFKSRVNGTLELKVTQGNKVIHFLALIKFSTNPPSLEKTPIKIICILCHPSVFINYDEFTLLCITNLGKQDFRLVPT